MQIGFSAEHVLVCIERLFYVRSAEYRRCDEGDDVGVGLQYLVYCVEAYKRGVGRNLPDLFRIEPRALCELLDAFGARGYPLGIEVSGGDDFNVLVGGYHVFEGVGSAPAAADELLFLSYPSPLPAPNENFGIASPAAPARAAVFIKSFLVICIPFVRYALNI